MIEFLRNFIGAPPLITSLFDLPQLVEYISAVFVLFLVMASIYAIIGNIVNIFGRR